MSVTLREGAFAKINLTLDVLGKRPDGYHDIQSVMQTISIRDDVEVEVGTAKPWTLSCDKEDVPQDSSNLAWKAAEMFCRAWPSESPSAFPPRRAWAAAAPMPLQSCGL